MKFELLKAIAKKFNQYQTIYSVRRVDDNLFRLTLDFDEFYLDMSKSKSAIFVTQEKILGNPYHAPFDLALSKYCSRAKLLSCCTDGLNRILIFEFLYLSGYKQSRCFLHFEFTGRHTNVILVDQEGNILEALRHISEYKSYRVIKPNRPFSSLPQPLKEHKITQEISTEQLNDLLAQVYQKLLHEGLGQKKQILIAQRQKKIDEFKTFLQDLPNPMKLKQEVQKYTLWGELIFSSPLPSYFSHHLKLQDHHGEEIEIILPQKILSYSQGGNFCFTQSKKLKQKIQNLEIQKEYLESKISFLKNEIDYIASIVDQQDLQVFMHKPSAKQKQEKKNYESFFIDGMKVSIGRNAKENQKLLQDAKADDIWLHIQNIPSAHMIIHCGKMKVREEVLRQSAKILVGINKIADKNILIDYTRRRFIKVVEGANVVYSKQKTLKI